MGREPVGQRHEISKYRDTDQFHIRDELLNEIWWVCMHDASLRCLGAGSYARGNRGTDDVDS
jgi:hypothetical protein